MERLEMLKALAERLVCETEGVIGLDDADYEELCELGDEEAVQELAHRLATEMVNDLKAL